MDVVGYFLCSFAGMAVGVWLSRQYHRHYESYLYGVIAELRQDLDEANERLRSILDDGDEWKGG